MHTNGPLNSDTNFPSITAAFGRAGQGFQSYVSKGWVAAGQGKGEALRIIDSQPSPPSASNNVDQDAPQASIVILQHSSLTHDRESKVITSRYFPEEAAYLK
jgi:hypothetical protein